VATLKELSESTVSRYSERYYKLGRDVKTLGWGNEEQQFFRFKQVMRIMQLSGKSLLDIGCGFGDFLSACRKNDINITKYIGWDINPYLIEEAKKSHVESSFEVVDLASLESVPTVAQVGVMLGVLNLNFKNQYDNFEFSKMMITRAFDAVSETLAVDFLSSHRSPNYPKEDFVYYHNPEEVLSYALSLTPNVRLHHDYEAIPQKEFMLVLEHV